LSNLRLSTTIGSTMKIISLALLLAVLSTLPTAVAGKEKPPPEPKRPIGWLHLDDDTHKFSASEDDFQRVRRKLAMGLLLPVYKTKERSGAHLAQVRIVNLEQGKTELGWTEAKLDDIKPTEFYPTDDDLLRLLGPEYYDDSVTSQTDIARYLVRQPRGAPVLLCYVMTAPYSLAKLVVYAPNPIKLAATSMVSVPISEIEAGISSIEIRDLLGNGTDCIVMNQHFRDQAQTLGVQMFIRRIVDGKLQDLWQAPTRYKNLSEYGARVDILQPPERNIGMPGTVTTGEVTFVANGKMREPHWKGKVDFYVIGREKVFDSVDIDKTCPWNGQTFAPLK
jgi:hypothetical protein